MGKRQIMSVPKEARETFDWDMFATWMGANADNGTWFIGGVIAACGFAVAMKVLVLSSAVSYMFLSLIGYIGYKTGVSTMEPSRIFFQFWMILFYFRDRADRIWSRWQNIFPIFGDFVLLLELRGPDLESAVEHFSNFWRFCSTFEVSRTEFGVGGRTFFRFLEILFYFRDRADRIWSRRQNIFPIFGDFVLLSRSRAPILESPVDKKEAFPPFFVYFRGRAGRIWSRWQTKMSHFLRFLSAFEVARPEFRPAGRQKSHIYPVFCLLPLRTSKRITGKKPFFKFCP